MKKILLLIHAFILTISFQITAQSWQWAFTTGTIPRSQAVDLKQDQAGNFYLATFSDSASTRISTQFEKRNINQQVEWQKQITGNATITDLEINAANHAVITGYFLGSITIDGNNLTSFSPTEYSGFIFETDQLGVVQWVHDLNPVSGDFKTNDLFISADGTMYLTSEVSGSFGFCAFHKLDAQGNIVKNEFNNNFEDRTFSHILADDAGNVYLSGTCGNGATFDSINADPLFSYQNFLVKYDSAFKAQWLAVREYITFDDNNGLSTDGQNLYWAFNNFTSGMDTIKIIKCDHDGQILNSIDGPLSNSFFPSIDFTVDRFGNGVLAANTFVRIFLFRYDNALNLTWQDTILTGTSGFPFNHGLSCYDSSFYLAAYYFSDTLMIDNFTLLNPNAATNYPTDIFVAKWEYQSPVAISTIEEDNTSIITFPNPVKNELNIKISGFKKDALIKITDVMGNVVYSEHIITSDLKIQNLNFCKGVYFVVMSDEKNNLITKKIVVM
jgi:hypothetical protein